MTNDELNRDAIARIEELARLGMMEAAEVACGELLARAPQEHRGWTWLGMLKLVRGQGAEAESALRQAVAIFPNDARYWNSLSLALRIQSRFADAEGAARNALALDGASEHWAGLGDCLFNQQQWQGAVQSYEQALTQNPQQAQVWTNLGAAEHALGHLDQAQAALERSLALAPNDPNAMIRYALLQVQRGQIQRGIEIVEHVLAREPNLLPAWLLLGNAERLRDNWPRAEAAYRQALQLSPRDRDARHNLALLRLQ